MKIIKRELKYKGLIFKVWREEYQEDPGLFLRDIVEFPETCAILPLLDGDTAILISQYRFPLRKEILEIPAGKIDCGESPEEAAQRELMEEVKMRAEKLSKIGTFYLTPGYSTERIHIFWGADLRSAELPADAGEQIKTHRIPLNKLKEMMITGEIEDAKTYIALLHYFNFIEKR